MCYFYVIQHIESGKLYAGSRTAKKCFPGELMKKNGYKTSSKIVREIIHKEGLESFFVRFIKIFKNKIDAINYETRFLSKIDAANNKKFLNCHNNELNQVNMIKASVELYGVENPFQSETIKEKIKQTNLNRYGTKHAMQNDCIKEKTKNTNKERYGGNSPICSKVVREKSREALIEKYGVDHPSKIKIKCEYCDFITNINHMSRHIKTHHLNKV